MWKEKLIRIKSLKYYPKSPDRRLSSFLLIVSISLFASVLLPSVVETVKIEPVIIQPQPVQEVVFKPVSEQKEAWHYELSPEDLRLIKATVAAESRGESREGQMAVAQCILTRMQKYDKELPALLNGQFARPTYEHAEQVNEAVLAVFKDGEMVLDSEVEYFYNPSMCNSSFHESLIHVGTIGSHRFFKEG